MKTSKAVHVSSETKQTQFSMQILDSSVQSLVKSWKRRQRWLLLFNTSSQQGLNSRAAWRTHLANFLDSTWLHVFTILLLIADLIITTLELSSSLVCCERRISSVAEECFHWIGIGILSFLVAKTMGLMVGLGCSFFQHVGYVVDGVVVIGAIILEGFVVGRGGGFLVVVSLWRFIRVVESVFELSDEAIEAQIAGIISQFEALREENIRLLEAIYEKEKIIEMLEEDLDNCRDESPLSKSQKIIKF